MVPPQRHALPRTGLRPRVAHARIEHVHRHPGMRNLVRAPPRHQFSRQFDGGPRLHDGQQVRIVGRPPRRQSERELRGDHQYRMGFQRDARKTETDGRSEQPVGCKSLDLPRLQLLAQGGAVPRLAALRHLFQRAQPVVAVPTPLDGLQGAPLGRAAEQRTAGRRGDPAAGRRYVVEIRFATRSVPAAHLPHVRQYDVGSGAPERTRLRLHQRKNPYRRPVA